MKHWQLKSCFLLIATVILCNLLARSGDYQNQDVGQMVTNIVSTMVVFTFAWLIQAYFKNRQCTRSGKLQLVWAFVFGMLAVLLLTYGVSILLPQNLLQPEARYQGTWNEFVKRLLAAFFVNFICYVTYNSLYTNHALQNAKLENEQLKRAHLQAQLIALQQQLSPHFLFNSLNTLKTIAGDHETKSFVVQLSHVYRYLLSNEEKQVVSLYEELSFANAYLYIQHQRFEKALDISIDIADEYKAVNLPTLSLQLLLENAIKHNAFSIDAPLSISVYVNDDKQLEIRNTYRPKRVPEPGTGLGLKNIEKRFRVLFNQTIGVSKSEHYFTVTLPLIFHESDHYRG